MRNRRSELGAAAVFLLLGTAFVAEAQSRPPIQRLSQSDYLVDGTPWSRFTEKIEFPGVRLVRWDADNDQVLWSRKVKSVPPALAVSRNGTIAYREYDPELEPDPTKAKGVLRFLDAQGAPIRNYGPQAPLLRYSWSPSGNRIAILTGRPADAPSLCILGPKVEILDPGAGTTETVFDGGSRMYWAEFDGNLYIYDECYDSDPKVNVYKYSPETKSVTKTKLRGIDFSTKGTYYFVHPEEIAPCEVYRREDNTSATRAVPSLVFERLQPLYWLDDEHIVAREWDDCLKQERSYLVSLVSGEVRKAPGVVLTWHTKDRLIATDPKSGELTLLPASALKKIDPEEIPLPVPLYEQE